MRGVRPAFGRHRCGCPFRLGWYSAWLVAIVGCGDGLRSNSRNFASAETGAPTAILKSADTTSYALAPGATSTAPPARQDDKADGTSIPPAVPRKIIYNAQVDLVVESMTATAEAVTRLVKANG